MPSIIYANKLETSDEKDRFLKSQKSGETDSRRNWSFKIISKKWSVIPKLSGREMLIQLYHHRILVNISEYQNSQMPPKK